MGRDSGMPRWTLRVESTHEEVRRARNWVAETLREQGFASEAVGDALLALGEALANIVRHGYRGVPGHPIDVTILASPEWLEFILEDEAPVFSGTGECQLPDPTELAEGGYGIGLMQTLMDEITREPRGASGNRLRLRKYHPAAEPRRTA